LPTLVETNVLSRLPVIAFQSMVSLSPLSYKSAVSKKFMPPSAMAICISFRDMLSSLTGNDIQPKQIEETCKSELPNAEYIICKDKPIVKKRYGPAAIFRVLVHGMKTIIFIFSVLSSVYNLPPQVLHL